MAWCRTATGCGSTPRIRSPCSRTASSGEPQTPRGQQWLRVAAIRLPRISNSTDVEALACEPGVLVRWVSDPADLADADVVVIPGSKATVADLAWLRQRGLADAVVAHAGLGKPVLGICGGFQMLCRRIDDAVESGAGGVDGLGVLDADIEFAPDKTLRRHEVPLHGYEIHHGQVSRSTEDDWLGVGIRRGAVYGTHWHGLLDNDDVRRQWLTAAAAAAGRSRVRRRRRRRRRRAPGRATRRDGRPDHQPRGRRRRDRAAGARPAGDCPRSQLG